MRTIRLLTTVACLAPWTLPASANDEVQKLIQDPNQWAMQAGDYANKRYSQARPDQRRQRRQAAGRLDVLDRRAARPRGLAAGHRRHDVRAHAVPEHRLRARPQQRRQDQLEVRAEAGPDRHPGDVLRHRQSRPRLRRRQDLPAAGRHARSSRSTPRPARWSGRSRTAIRRRARPTPRTACCQGQGHRRHLRRRVRACAASSPPTTSTTASRSGGPTRSGPTTRC